jgi:sugar lactone lactonase YvrE
MAMRSRTPLWLTLCAVLALTAAGPAMTATMAAPMVVQNVGLQTPESVLYDAAADAYLVANINGNPTGTDGNGFISRIMPNGRTVTLKWIDGTKSGVTLNAPKGMAIAQGTLYVADITAVRMFDRRTGRFKGSIDIPGATFLNDLAAGPDGSIYLTDSGLKPDFSPSGTDAVYRITPDGKVDTVAKRTDLKGPNGITLRSDGRLVIVNFAKPGQVVVMGLNGQALRTWTLPAGQLDGVEALPDGSLLVSSWETSTVYRVTADGTATAAVENVPSPADIGYDRKRNRVLIPLFTKNQIVIQSMK